MKTKFRKRRCAVILLFNAFFVVVIFISSYHQTRRLARLKEIRLNKTILHQKQANLISSSGKNVMMRDSKRAEGPVILFWTKYFGDDPSPNLGKCAGKCRLVLNKSDFGISDAVVFHSRDMRKNEMPLTHPSHQIWVYLQQESPFYTRANLTEYKNVFNWTMTYRRDSDVYHPYFRTVPIHNHSKVDKHNYSSRIPPTFSSSYYELVQRKTKLVAWIVSNCEVKSKRQNFVSQLESFIPIDIYGDCGDFSCPRNGEGCLPKIARQYKFYLSFENSLCADYVTEKFSNPLQYSLVPIVYGGGDYAAIAPPGSFINTNDFASPKALADYLLLLDRNPDLYLRYFRWKGKYKVVSGDGWCSLCRKLVQQKAKPFLKTYENLSEWWYKHKPKYSESTGHGGESLMPVCREPSVGFADKWNSGIVNGVKYVRRWFYKRVLGH